MYKNVVRITREQYKQMLDAGRKFRNWSLYEPQNNPHRTYYLVDLGNGLTANKVEIK